MSETGENVDYSKLKVNDLKKLLKDRGLSVVGNKAELVERLQSSEAAEALLEGSEVGDHYDEALERELDETPLEDLPKKDDSLELTLDDSVVEGDKKIEETKKPDTNETEKSNEDKNIKVNLKNVALSDDARKKARAERFGNSTSKSVLTQRAERFASKTAPTATKADSTTSIVTTKNQTVGTPDALKRRAERFGLLSPVEAKRQHLEKLQARKMRFSQSSVDNNSQKVTTSGKEEATTVVNKDASLEERKLLRAQRFKMVA